MPKPTLTPMLVKHKNCLYLNDAARHIFTKGLSLTFVNGFWIASKGDSYKFDERGRITSSMLHLLLRWPKYEFEEIGINRFVLARIDENETN